MDTQELLKRVRAIEIKTRGLSSQIFAGEFNSAFKGKGMSFSEVRAYQYGDDVRQIDWNVSARLNEPYVKVFEEEREMTVMLLVDVSASSLFGSFHQSKKQFITELSAVLAFSAMKNNDKVGIMFFTDRIEKYIPPKKGRKHILHIIRELVDLEPIDRGTDISEALIHYNNMMKKRAISFIISDFIDEGYSKPLSIASRRHDLVGLKIFDPFEKELPKVGLLRSRDPETGEEIWLDTNSKKLRYNYAEEFIQRSNSTKEVFRRAGVDLLELGTDRSYVSPLLQFFKRRSSRI